MKGFDTLHVKSAVKARNRIPLSNSHVTTADFGQLLVLKNFETIAGGEYPLSAEYFCRTAPLVRPTFGKFNFKVVNAYVPYHQVAFDADAFMDGSLIFEGSTPVLRHITGLELFYFFLIRFGRLKCFLHLVRPFLIPVLDDNDSAFIPGH